MEAAGKAQAQASRCGTSGQHIHSRPASGPIAWRTAYIDQARDGDAGAIACPKVAPSWRVRTMK